MLKEGQIVRVKPRLKAKDCSDGFSITKEMEALKGQYLVIEKRIEKDRYHSRGWSWKENCFTKESIKENNFVRGKKSDGEFNENDIVLYEFEGKEPAVLKYDGTDECWYLDYLKVMNHCHKRPGSSNERLFEDTGWNICVPTKESRIIRVEKRAYENLEEFLEEREGKKMEEIIETEEDLKQEQFKFDNEVMEKLSSSIDKLTKKIDREDPFKKAMTEAIIEKGKDLAIDDLKKRLKTDLDKYIEETYGTLPKIIAIEKEGKVKKEIKGLFHSKFEDICKIVSKGIPLMLVGGAGAGKNHTLE